MRDGDVAEERARLAVDDSQVCVVALEGGEESEGDGVGGVEGEGGGRVEVFNGGLARGKDSSINESPNERLSDGSG